MWRLWCYALGKKEGRSQRDADNIALIRTIILFSYLITNCFIIAGVIRHWNANTNDTSGSILECSCHELHSTR